MALLAFDLPVPTGLLVSGAAPLASRASWGDELWLEQLARERKGLAKKYVSLRAPQTEAIAHVKAYFVGGASKRYPKARRREGYVVGNGFYARFIEHRPLGVAKVAEAEKGLKGAWRGLRLGRRP